MATEIADLAAWTRPTAGSERGVTRGQWYSYHRYPAKRGWSERYRPIIEGALELVVFVGFLLTVLAVGFFAAWVPQP